VESFAVVSISGQTSVLPKALVNSSAPISYAPFDAHRDSRRRVHWILQEIFQVPTNVFLVPREEIQLKYRLGGATQPAIFVQTDASGAGASGI
jgi:hypothetical protein